jgi:hypothetical protein
MSTRMVTVRFILATIFVSVPPLICPNADTGTSPIGSAAVPAAVALNPGSVSPAAYKQSSDPDDTASVQRALETCKTVRLGEDITYYVSSTMYFCDGGHQKIVGTGVSTVVKPLNGFHGTTRCSDSAGTHWSAVFANFNCGADKTSDTNIELAHFSLDNSANTTEKRSLIAIFNRSTTHVYIHGILCNTFADCTATLHSSDTLVADSMAINNFNAGFDAWDSPSNMTVKNTTVYCSGTTASYGLLYNATNTNVTVDGRATRFTAIDNKQFKCFPGIFIDPLTTNGLVQGVTIIRNVEDNFNLTTASYGGIAITGHVSGVTITAAILRNMNDGQLYVGKSGVPNDAGIPDHVSIVFPRLINVRNINSVCDLRCCGSCVHMFKSTRE